MLVCSDVRMQADRLPRGLVSGDVVAVVSPASWPSEEVLEGCLTVVRSWGFQPQLSIHARDRWGYLAGLRFGHDPDPRLATLGVPCTLDADAGSLTLSAALSPSPSG
jgi:muramoyltetrapeptide carboxypeptidase LdcA involved in peptidoglycan recycling